MICIDFSGHIMAAKQNNPLVILLFYSILMITLPITAFFVSQYIIDHYMNTSTSNSYIYSTACSVIVIHIILGLFVYKAYKEDKVAPIEKED